MVMKEEEMFYTVIPEEVEEVEAENIAEDSEELTRFEHLCLRARNIFAAAAAVLFVVTLLPISSPARCCLFSWRRRLYCRNCRADRCGKNQIQKSPQSDVYALHIRRAIYPAWNQLFSRLNIPGCADLQSARRNM